MKTLLITGAASGIGLATAQLLADRFHVVVADREGERATLVAEKITAQGGAASAVGVDVSKAASVEAMMDKLRDQVGDIDALFCNAGISGSRSVEEITALDWNEMLDVHVKGAYLCARAVLPRMCERRAGAIVMMASDYSVRGKAMGAAYATAKSAIYSLAKSLAVEFAPYGVRCNCVGPGPIETPLLRAGRDDAAWRAAKQERSKQVPMGRLGTSQEVASVVDYLIGEESSYITGQIIHPNGGQISW
jgi:NAD(P)-dependent dehydrogenase (short-subunit alcohol dehydrogenase family)